MSKRTSVRELNELINQNIFMKLGDGKNTEYILA